MKVRAQRLTTAATLVVAAGLLLARPQRSTATLAIRGKAQTLQIYGQRGGAPVVVTSGDGGWIHLAPHVAETLAAKSYFVVGFDAKAYLESFTAGSKTLTEDQVPEDYRLVIDFAAGGATEKPILVGVSEGAGLSVLAATRPAVKVAIGGVIGLGLPDINELGWRWRDMITYVTKRAPNEPSFSAAAVAADVAPVPLAAIHSTNDEFVPLAVVQRVIERASEPKKLWIVQASDHRFSGNIAELDERLFEALAWARANEPR
jgi:fermentation-respiration switch protein FrsA (DUF1100 family)